MNISYKICIGSYFDVSKSQNVPKQTINITQEQYDIIELFADKRKDSELNTIYKLNECEFTIKPFIFQTPEESIKAFTQ